MKKLIPIIFFFISALSADASHMMGGEITYKRISSLKYEVTLIWYRDCRGIPLNNAGQISIKCSNGGSINDVLTLVSIADIIPYCATASSKCNPVNATSGEGTEKHTYKSIIDFNTSPLSGLASCSGKIIISAIIASRNGAITTGPAGTIYIDAELDLANASTNSSPVISAPALGYLCCNQPFYYTFNAIDTLDYDSLTYSLISPRSSASTPTSYSGAFSYASPFTVYDPRTPPQPNNPLPNYTPPIGLYLNPTSGDLIFMPTNCSEVTVLVVQITEWRKDSTGTPKVIGKTLRDMQFIVKSCPNNNPPTIDGPFSHSVCEGDEICFNISTDDVTFQPPPPTSAPAPDTTKLSWNGAISGASFYVLSDTVLHQKGRFCWTPPVGSSRSWPYSFVATVKDNACPVNAVTFRSFQVRVKKRVTSSLTVTRITPDLFLLKSQIDSATFVGTPSYSCVILDSMKRTVLDTNAAKFISTNAYFSNKQIDTLRLKRNGQFIVERTINNAPNNCPSVYYDTIRVDSMLQTLINYPKDTLVCAGTSELLSTSTVFAQGTPSYQWYKNDTILLPGETSPSYTVQNIPRLADETYSIWVTDAAGNINKDKIRIRAKDNYDNSFAYLYEACLGDSIILQLDTVFTNRLWHDNATDSVRVYHQSAVTWVSYQDSFHCVYSDSIDVIVHALPHFNLGNDTTFCGDSLFLALSLRNTYRWSTGDSLNFSTINTSGDYWVQLTDSNGCSVTDTANLTLLSNTNVPVLTKNGLVITSNLSGTHHWFKDENLINGQSDSFITISSIGSYNAVHIDSNGCISDTSNTITKTAGVERLSSSSLTIYPNPTNGKVTIDASGLGTIHRVELYDNLGKLVANTQTINGSVIDLAWEARSGVLWVVVATDSGVFKQAVVSVR
jgi:hypothetical protein